MEKVNPEISKEKIDEYINIIKRRVQTLERFFAAADFLKDLKISSLKYAQSLPHLRKFFLDNPNSALDKLMLIKSNVIFDAEDQKALDNISPDLMLLASAINKKTFKAAKKVIIPENVNVTVFGSPNSYSGSWFYGPVSHKKKDVCFGNIISAEFLAALLTASPDSSVKDVFDLIISNVVLLMMKPANINGRCQSPNHRLLPIYSTSSSDILQCKFDQFLPRRAVSVEQAEETDDAIEVYSAFTDALFEINDRDTSFIRKMKEIGFQILRIPGAIFGSLDDRPNSLSLAGKDDEEPKPQSQLTIDESDKVETIEDDFDENAVHSEEYYEAISEREESPMLSYIQNPVRVEIARMNTKEILRKYYTEGQGTVTLFYEVVNNVLSRMGADQKFVPFDYMGMKFFDDPNYELFEKAVDPLSNGRIASLKYFARTRYSIAKYLSVQYQDGHNYYSVIGLAWEQFKSIYKQREAENKLHL